jgi:hypothetical protein
MIRLCLVRVCEDLMNSFPSRWPPLRLDAEHAGDHLHWRTNDCAVTKNVRDKDMPYRLRMEYLIGLYGYLRAIYDLITNLIIS